MIAISFALPAESADVVRSLLNRREVVVNETQFLEGKWHRRDIALCHTGVGANISQRRVRDFLNGLKISCLMSAGFAGALVDTLRVGDLFLAANFSHPELLAFSQKILPGQNLKIGNLITAPAVVADAKARSDLGAKSGASAVDMETESIARICAERGVPLLSLRAITDTSSNPFPVPVADLFDLERQKTDLTRIGLYLLGHPARIIPLVRFARAIARARATLTNALALLVKSGEF